MILGAEEVGLGANNAKSNNNTTDVFIVHSF
jgi:hypothetical protein